MVVGPCVDRPQDGHFIGMLTKVWKDLRELDPAYAAARLKQKIASRPKVFHKVTSCRGTRSNSTTHASDREVNGPPTDPSPTTIPSHQEDALARSGTPDRFV